MTFMKTMQHANITNKTNQPSPKGLARFEYLKQLGDGTFGSVHLFRTKDTNDLVAVKSSVLLHALIKFMKVFFLVVSVL